MSTTSLASDEKWMQLALDLAKRGLGLTHPNPPVGAVILAADGELAGEGWHKKAGGPHAEVDALVNCTRDPAGGTAYVSLEPCTTHGRTPPCANALKKAGIRRVVWCMDDPNPSHRGAAAAFFKEHGMATTSGILEDQGRELLRPWSTYISQDRPYVVVKAAISLDGKLTLPQGEGQWLSCPESRADAMALRVASDAILVGANTVRNDDPGLMVRPDSLLPEGKPQPWRLIWSRKKDALPVTAQVFTDKLSGRTQVLNQPNVQELLRELKAREIVQVLVEGGSQVITQLLRDDLVDELHLYLSPLISGTGLPLVQAGLWGTTASQPWKLTQFQRIKDDLKLVYRRQ